MRPRKWTYLIVSGLLLFPAVRLTAGGGQAYAGAAEPATGGSLKTVDVSESVVMLENEKVHGSNVTCLASDDGLVFVDCGLFTDIAAEFRRDMEARFEQKTIALFLTHAHTDHFFGMGAFADVPVIAASAEKPLFEQQLSIDYASRVESYKRIFPLFDEALKTARPFAPTRWFDEEMKIGGGKNAVVLRRTGGHTAGSSCAMMLSEGVLVSGDNVQVDFFPYFGDRTGDMNVWIETLRRWEGLNLRKVCPGHGRVVDGHYVTAVREYYEELVATLKKLKSQGIPVQEAVAHPDLPAGYWPPGLEKPGWFDPAVAALYGSLTAD